MGRHLRILLAGWAVAISLSGDLSAQNDNGNKAIDAQIHSRLKDVINYGADLYNEPHNNHAGCYRLYEGALMAYRPFLSHRPELQQAIDKGLADASSQPRLDRRAFVLREVIDNIRAVVSGKDGGSKPVTPKPVTLWEKLGGEKNVRKVVDDFVAAAATDPKVNFTRDGKYKLDADAVKALKQRLVEMISAHSGGPFKYSGKAMKPVHEGMQITNEEFDATVGHLVKALKDNGAKAEDIETLGKVVESTRKDIVEGKKPTPPPTAKTLWDRLGGEKAVVKVVDDFVNSAATDPKVNFTRDGKYKLDDKAVVALKKSLVDMISAVSKGPRKYSGGNMKEVHKGMGITEAEFNATAVHLANALKKNGADPKASAELLTLVGGTKGQIVEEKGGTSPEPQKDAQPKDDKPTDKPPVKDDKPDDKPPVKDAPPKP